MGSPTMSPSRRRSARRTSGKTVSLSMRRLLLMRPSMFAELLWSRTVTSRDLKYAELNMSQSAGCGFKEGTEECYDKKQTVVQDAPKEQCSLEPQRTCKHVTKLVPKLTPTEECVDVPKEVCSRSRTNPRKVKKPVVKKWCYVPSEESGLA